MQPLRYYMHDGPAAFRFELAGILSDAAAGELEQAWQTAASVIGDRQLIVDISFLRGAGERGSALLLGWYRAGARLIANSSPSQVLAAEILGGPPPASSRNASAHSEMTWFPFAPLR